MPTLQPVDHDPFDGSGPMAMPVSHDPFAVSARPISFPLASALDASGMGADRLPLPQQAELSSYNPSLTERMKGFVQDRLMGLGANAYDAGHIAGGVTSIAGMTPAGIPMAFDEARRAADRGNVPGVALSALGMIPGARGAGAVARGTAALPMDVASRMARAEQMGFRTGMPLYHGSGESFSAFRAVPTTAAGMETPGVSVALDPAVANEFALGIRSSDLARRSEPASPQVYPLVHRAENPATMTLDGTESHGEVVGALRDAFESGHDAVMLKNYTTPGGNAGQNIVIVKDANQLRSPNAAFDPAKKFSPELPAGLGGGALLIPVDHDPFASR